MDPWSEFLLELLHNDDNICRWIKIEKSEKHPFTLDHWEIIFVSNSFLRIIIILKRLSIINSWSLRGWKLAQNLFTSARFVEDKLSLMEVYERRLENRHFQIHSWFKKCEWNLWKVQNQTQFLRVFFQVMFKKWFSWFWQKAFPLILVITNSWPSRVISFPHFIKAISLSLEGHHLRFNSWWSRVRRISSKNCISFSRAFEDLHYLYWMKDTIDSQQSRVVQTCN